MHTVLQESIEQIRKHLAGYFDREASTFLEFKPWGPDLKNRLREYSLRGKLIRGALVPFGCRLFDRDSPVPPACYQAGVAMELLQAFLLIHDDIMDQDAVRRGGPAIHAQYQALREHDPGSRQYGLSQGISAGDVAAFLAMERMSSLPVNAELRSELSALVAREIVSVGLAQMQDVHHGYVDTAGEEEILRVYTYKTGRYTFSLPLMVGARLGGASADQIDLIAQCGDSLGRIFQIRDDQLGLFGSEEGIGKPAGSDIRENKKTLFRERLLQKLPVNDPRRTYFGSSSVSEEQIETIREAVVSTGVLQEIETRIEAEENALADTITALNLSAEADSALRDLVAFNNARRK